jgi:hypothetical protein
VTPEPIRPFRDTPATDLSLAHLRNLGPKSAASLAAIGITTRAQLAARRSIGVCEELRAAGHPVSINMAYAIEGALSDCDWRALPAETVRELKQDWARLKQTRA